MYMRIKMKNILMLALLLVFDKTAAANMVLVSFELNGASSDRKFMVNNLHAPTSVDFRFNLMKYSDPSSPGDCYVTLLYTESPENNNFESHPSTIEISPTKHVLKSEFASHGTIYQSVWLPAILPAYRFSGKIVLRYRFFHSAQDKEVSWYSTVKYDVTTPASPISNDDYTGAIDLSSTFIAGMTMTATQSSQAEPACGSGIDDDVWYKFTATSTSHLISLSDVSFHFNGGQHGTPLAGIAIYNSNLGYIGCDNVNQKITATSLVVGQTYYVRLWTASIHTNVRMTYKIAISTPGVNSVTNILASGHLFTAVFAHDPTIPLSDIAIEWSLVPPAIGEADHYGIEMHPWGNNPYQVFLTSSDGDVATRIAARLKRISTNTPISSWFTRNALIWFDPPIE